MGYPGTVSGSTRHDMQSGTMTISLIKLMCNFAHVIVAIMMDCVHDVHEFIRL